MQPLFDMFIPVMVAQDERKKWEPVEAADGYVVHPAFWHLEVQSYCCR